MKRPAPTFDISVHFWRDPKVLAAGYKAAVLWLRCGCESRAILSDGVILEGQIPAHATDLGDWKELAELLVVNDLWKRCKGGYRIPAKRWETWQMTKAQVEEAREFERERKRRQRAKASPPLSPDGVPGGTPPESPERTSTSTSTSASQSASALQNQPEGRASTPVPPTEGVHQRRRGFSSRWSWLAGWKPEPGDTPRTLLTRLGVEEPSASALIHAGATLDRIHATAIDVHGDARVVSPVRILVDRLQRELGVEKAKRAGPLAGETMRSLQNIERMREARHGAG